jgi:hypothetical protein
LRIKQQKEAEERAEHIRMEAEAIKEAERISYL